MPRRHLLATLSALLAGSLCLPALAQADYPSRPITLVVGYPPGGSVDLAARIVSPELGKQLGQAVVVENAGGAGGTIGAQRVASASADGYTLLVGSSNEIAIAKLVNPKLRYESQRDFTPIGLIDSQPLVLVAAPHTGVKTIDDFIKAVKAKPGKFTYGSSGIGTALHLAGEMVKESAGLFMVHVPYRGVGPLTTDLLGGQVDFGVFVLSSALPQIRAGKLIALGTTEARRSQAAPDIPALSEHPALRKVNIASWVGLYGPAKLPPAVAQRLGRALQATMVSPAVRKQIEEAGARPTANEGKADEMLAAYLKVEQEKYARIVDFAKIHE